MTQSAAPEPGAPGDGQQTAPAAAPAPSTGAIGAYSQRELQFVEREARGELAFRYIRNDGEPQHLEWCAPIHDLNLLAQACEAWTCADPVASRL